MYSIYEIKGVKIGCTRSDQWDVRQKAQLKLGKMVLLESCNCMYEASSREIELQKQYNYSVDEKPYYKVLQMQKLATAPEARKKAVANTDHIQRTKNTDYVSIGKKISKARQGMKLSEAHKAAIKAGSIIAGKYKRKPVKAFKVIKKIHKNGFRNGKILGIKTKFYKNFNSLTQASKELKITTSDIRMVINPKTINKTAKGYTFEYA